MMVYTFMTDEENSKRRVVTEKEEVMVRKIGSSRYVRIPKTWSILKILQDLTVVSATVQIDADGVIYLEFKKEKKNCQQK